MLLKLNNNRNGKLELKMGLRVVELALQATHWGKARNLGSWYKPMKGQYSKTVAYVAQYFFFFFVTS